MTTCPAPHAPPHTAATCLPALAVALVALGLSACSGGPAPGEGASAPRESAGASDGQSVPESGAAEPDVTDGLAGGTDREGEGEDRGEPTGAGSGIGTDDGDGAGVEAGSGAANATGGGDGPDDESASGGVEGGDSGDGSAPGGESGGDEDGGGTGEDEATAGGDHGDGNGASGDERETNEGSFDGPVACSASSEAIRERALSLINAARAQARLCGTRRFEAAAPVSWNERLRSAAAAHSTDMAAHNFFSHTGSDGSSLSQRVNASGYAWTGIGENIAAGQRDVATAVDGWIDSPGHCRNLMNPAFTEIALACAEDDGADFARYWTNVLAAGR